MNWLSSPQRSQRSTRVLAVLPLAFVAVAATVAASLGIQASHQTGRAFSASHGLVRMAPACTPPGVLDIDGLGTDATWNAVTDDLTTIGHSLSIDPLDSVVDAAQVIVGDPSAVADPSDLAISSPDVVARAVASIQNATDNLVSLVADLVLDPPDLGNLPVFVLINYTPSESCGGVDGGYGVVAVPVGTLVVQ